MTSEGTTPAKLLFLLSNDFGELSLALDFTRGQSFAPLLLAPGRLFGVNAGRLAVRVQPYASITDVRRVVAAEAPDVVFLCSGYLYAVNQLFDLAALRTLLVDLQRLAIPVATTDPFLGLLAHANGSTFRADHPLRAAFAQHFAETYALLSELPHLYLSDPSALAPPHRLSWFNPHVLESDTPRVNGQRRRWLFVLSSEDYAAQINARGNAAFERTLAGLLHHARAQGRQPVLIAPEPCIAALGPVADGTVLLSHCGHDAFRSQCDAAEHVFFWNMLSHSVAARLLKRRSAFLFTPGHLADAMPPLAELAIAHYYAGARPHFLDPDAPPDTAELDRLAAEQDAALAPARARMSALPSPATVVARLRSVLATA